ncbi:ubiquitin E3 ligase ICP0-2 [Beluga whale alphaherpesvirus 1]|uniref:Ubiquitin E3 ligase ICP0-2 n=1 Tax=Beluga whale alphaherpesvirus 1 TaxID=1434720 RepID=A0A286RUF4_9ALPH|nr:ubiquitin E3 ligase ICP0-2 [Beluga whale alphaherpesvirus 1]ASW27048.1 ubiquitin E3 ligase ICP0-2 [Beluga whale alphaherpesvirus 1]
MGRRFICVRRPAPSACPRGGTDVGRGPEDRGGPRGSGRGRGVSGSPSSRVSPPGRADAVPGPAETPAQPESPSPGARPGPPAAPDTPPRCCICLDDLRRPATTLPCRHDFCLGCIERWLASELRCPLCQQTVAAVRYGVGNDDVFIETPIEQIHAPGRRDPPVGEAEDAADAGYESYSDDGDVAPPAARDSDVDDREEPHHYALPPTSVARWVRDALARCLNTAPAELSHLTAAAIGSIIQYGASRSAMTGILTPMLGGDAEYAAVSVIADVTRHAKSALENPIEPSLVRAVMRHAMGDGEEARGEDRSQSAGRGVVLMGAVPRRAPRSAGPQEPPAERPGSPGPERRPLARLAPALDDPIPRPTTPGPGGWAETSAGAGGALRPALVRRPSPRRSPSSPAPVAGAEGPAQDAPLALVSPRPGRGTRSEDAPQRRTRPGSLADGDEGPTVSKRPREEAIAPALRAPGAPGTSASVYAPAGAFPAPYSAFSPVLPSLGGGAFAPAAAGAPPLLVALVPALAEVPGAICGCCGGRVPLFVPCRSAGVSPPDARPPCPPPPQ